MSLETFALDPSSGQLRLISTFIVIRVLRRSAHIVLLRMGCDVLQSFENRGRDRMRGWKMFTLRLEAIFIGDVRQRDRRSLCIWITERSLNDHYRIRVVHLLQLTVLLHLNAVSSFVGEDVRAIYVRSIGAVCYYRHWCVVNWRGGCGNRDDGEDSANLESWFFYWNFIAFWTVLLILVYGKFDESLRFFCDFIEFLWIDYTDVERDIEIEIFDIVKYKFWFWIV